MASGYKQGSYGTMLSLKLSPKLEQEQSSVDNFANIFESDDIPFAHEIMQRRAFSDQPPEVLKHARRSNTALLAQ